MIRRTRWGNGEEPGPLPTRVRLFRPADEFDLAAVYVGNDKLELTEDAAKFDAALAYIKHH